LFGSYGPLGGIPADAICGNVPAAIVELVFAASGAEGMLDGATGMTPLGAVNLSAAVSIEG
jgi:hypothetical protein